MAAIATRCRGDIAVVIVRGLEVSRGMTDPAILIGDHMACRFTGGDNLRRYAGRAKAVTRVAALSADLCTGMSEGSGFPTGGLVTNLAIVASRHVVHRFSSRAIAIMTVRTDDRI